MPSQNAYLVDQNKHQNNKQNKNQNKNQTNNSLIKIFQTDVINWNGLDDLVKFMISTFVARNREIARLRIERELTFHFSARVVDPCRHLWHFHELKTAATPYRIGWNTIGPLQNDPILNGLVLQVFNQHFKLVRASDDDVNITAPCWNEVNWRIDGIARGHGPATHFGGDFQQSFRATLNPWVWASI